MSSVSLIISKCKSRPVDNHYMTIDMHLIKRPINTKKSSSDLHFLVWWLINKTSLESVQSVHKQEIYTTCYQIISHLNSFLTTEHSVSTKSEIQKCSYIVFYSCFIQETDLSIANVSTCLGACSCADILICKYCRLVYKIKCFTARGIFNNKRSGCDT